LFNIENTLKEIEEEVKKRTPKEPPAPKGEEERNQAPKKPLAPKGE